MCIILNYKNKYETYSYNVVYNYFKMFYIFKVKITFIILEGSFCLIQFQAKEIPQELNE